MSSELPGPFCFLKALVSSCQRETSNSPKHKTWHPSCCSQHTEFPWLVSNQQRYWQNVHLPCFPLNPNNIYKTVQDFKTKGEYQNIITHQSLKCIKMAVSRGSSLLQHATRIYLAFFHSLPHPITVGQSEKKLQIWKESFTEITDVINLTNSSLTVTGQQ